MHEDMRVLRLHFSIGVRTAQTPEKKQICSKESTRISGRAGQKESNYTKLDPSG
jgi:hypothetical protein